LRTTSTKSSRCAPRGTAIKEASDEYRTAIVIFDFAVALQGSQGSMSSAQMDGATRVCLQTVAECIFPAPETVNSIFTSRSFTPDDTTFRLLVLFKSSEIAVERLQILKEKQVKYHDLEIPMEINTHKLQIQLGNWIPLNDEQESFMFDVGYSRYNKQLEEKLMDGEQVGVNSAMDISAP
jgi:hypothetical protein